MFSVELFFLAFFQLKGILHLVKGFDQAKSNKNLA
jgi:hypothetical protein